jgi:hypothetical protein
MSPIADDFGPQANKSRSPHQQSFWIGSATIASQQIADDTSHGFGRIGRGGQMKLGMGSIGSVIIDGVNKFADHGLDALSPTGSLFYMAQTPEQGLENGTWIGLEGSAN